MVCRSAFLHFLFVIDIYMTDNFFAYWSRYKTTSVVHRPLPSIALHPSNNIQISHSYKVNEYKIAENNSFKVSILTHHIMSKSYSLWLFVIIRLSRQLACELDILMKFWSLHNKTRFLWFLGLFFAPGFQWSIKLNCVFSYFFNWVPPACWPYRKTTYF